MWTKNSNGDPYNWVDPSHKITTRDEMSKDARLAIAISILSWFEGAVAYLAHENWSFAVDSKGKYLPGTPTGDAPSDFANVLGTWSLTLRVLSRATRKPHKQSELTEARERIHEVVTIVLMNLIGSPKTGKWLAAIRKEHGLPKLRKADIIGVQGLLF